MEAVMNTKTKTKSKKKLNKAWLHDHINDPYVKLAQRDGYRARAAYKLKEIDEGLQLIRPGQLVVDLGSTPGAWSQYVRNRMSPGRPPVAGRQWANSMAAFLRWIFCRWSRSRVCSFCKVIFASRRCWHG